MKGSRIALTILLTGALLPVSLGASQIACASEGPRAALVVDTGSGVHRFCVSLPSAQVSGIELIKLANQQHGLQYRLGFGGSAVCQLAGVGPDGDDCFAEHPNFWGYWRGDGSGGWNWSSSGAGSTAVRDGSVEGWSWGSGQDGNSHPRPPATTFGSVCPAVRAQPKTGSGSGSGSESGGGSSSGSAGSSKGTGAGSGSGGPSRDPATTEGIAEDDDGEPADGDKVARKKRMKGQDSSDSSGMKLGAPATPSPEAAPEELADSAPAGEDRGAPPAAGLAALGAAGLMFALGGMVRRRRGDRAA